MTVAYASELDGYDEDDWSDFDQAKDHEAPAHVEQHQEQPKTQESTDRPWWCAHCHAPPLKPEDRLYGVCGGCALRERGQRERARASRETEFTMTKTRGSR